MGNRKSKGGHDAEPRALSEEGKKLYSSAMQRTVTEDGKRASLSLAMSEDIGDRIMSVKDKHGFVQLLIDYREHMSYIPMDPPVAVSAHQVEADLTREVFCINGAPIQEHCTKNDVSILHKALSRAICEELLAFAPQATGEAKAEAKAALPRQVGGAEPDEPIGIVAHAGPISMRADRVGLVPGIRRLTKKMSWRLRWLELGTDFMLRVSPSEQAAAKARTARTSGTPEPRGHAAFGLVANTKAALLSADSQGDAGRTFEVTLDKGGRWHSRGRSGSDASNCQQQYHMFCKTRDAAVRWALHSPHNIVPRPLRATAVCDRCVLRFGGCPSPAPSLPVHPERPPPPPHPPRHTATATTAPSWRSAPRSLAVGWSTSTTRSC